jgi:hypothetical protein
MPLSLWPLASGRFCIPIAQIEHQEIFRMSFSLHGVVFWNRFLFLVKEELHTDSHVKAEIYHTGYTNLILLESSVQLLVPA